MTGQLAMMNSHGTALRGQDPTPAPAAGGVSPSEGARRLDGLEAYRGIAALLIVVYHAYQHSRLRSAYVYDGTPLHVLLRNLEAGVAWFFVLSGFLIVLPFARAAAGQQSTLSARGFLVRRAIRIVPLYYVAILVVWTLRYTGGPGQWRDLLEHLTFTQIFDQTHIFWTIGPAWSLAVEALFYLVVAMAGPLAVRTCGHLGTPRARLAFLGGGAVALAVASVAYKWWVFAVAHIPTQNYPVYFGPLAQLDTFALGMLLAVAVVAAGRRPILGGTAPALLRLAGGALLAMTFVLRATSTPVALYFHTLSGVACVLVLASTVLGPRGTVWERLLAWHPLQVLGVISYSLYLWHEPLLIGLGHVLSFETARTFPVATLVLVAVSVVVATLSYWGLEYPTRLLRYLFTREGRLARRYSLR